MSFWKWSRTAATNATADGSINWAEGQAPSSVNDSARAMMAAAAKFRDDVAGAITTGGSSTAYTVSTYQSFDSLAHLDGQQIAFVPHTTSAGSAGSQITLAVDGLTAKPIRFAPSLEIPSGSLVQGTPYVVAYNNSDGAFYLRGLGSGNPYNIPLGGMLPYTGTTAPNTAFVLPFGQAISRTTYATYFSLVSTTYGTGDGSTTFNIIDMRGRVPAGQDNMGGSAAGRIGSSVVTDNGTINGTTVGSTGGSATHILTTSEIPAHNHGVTDSGHTHTLQGGTAVIAQVTGNAAPASANTFTYTTGSTTTGITINNTGGGAAHAMLQPTIIVPYILRVI